MTSVVDCLWLSLNILSSRRLNCLAPWTRPEYWLVMAHYHLLMVSRYEVLSSSEALAAQLGGTTRQPRTFGVLLGLRYKGKWW